jgi:hypothetical protein
VLITTPALATTIGLMDDATGNRAFVGASALGGVLCDYKLLVSDQLGANKLIAVNPSAILRAVGDIEFASSTVTAIEQSSAPTGDTQTPAAESQAFTSMFQEESIAVKAVRFLNWALRDANAVQLITGAEYAIAGA